MLERLRAVAFDRGVKGESGALLGLWILMAGFRFLRKRAGRTNELVYRGELEPGQQLIITHQTETHG